MSVARSLWLGNVNSLLIFALTLFFVSKVSIKPPSLRESPFLALFRPFFGGLNLLDLVRL